MKYSLPGGNNHLLSRLKMDEVIIPTSKYLHKKVLDIYSVPIMLCIVSNNHYPASYCKVAGSVPGESFRNLNSTK
jgi:hypothetical protein